MDEELLRLWPRAEEVLDALIDLPEGERRQRVSDACGGDTELERAVLAMLRADETSGDFLSASPVGLLVIDASSAADADAAPPLPERVGPFRIVREIARGGMGAVLLAERDDGQFTQRVALKLLHAGSRSPKALEGLLREREILGRLEHPGVARIYDGGVTTDGVPYYAMEFVDGRPIDEHCRAEGLDLEARLRLIRQVCLAVEYTHSRLVVHRDLKPSNIFVTHDGIVKLLDFGIAKDLVEDEAPGAAPSTQTSARVLTPAYAAPEQFRGEPVTVATDVYQLGLVIYELLTGRRVHAGPTTSPLAFYQQVMEADPPRPSRAVVEAGDNAALARQLDGDIDAIVLKALRKEPEQRYATMEALRRDIDDFLAHRPVSARRGTRVYRARKLLRRHRFGVAALVAVLASLAAGLAGVTVQSRIAARERDRARSAEAKASAVNEFLVNELLRAPKPERALTRTPTVLDVLENAARSVGHAFTAQPETEAEVREALARTYEALGRLDDARKQAESAHQLLAASYGEKGLDTQRTRRLVAELAIDAGQFAAARAQLEALYQAEVASLGADHVETLETAAALGRALTGEGKSAAAEAVLAPALALTGERHQGLWRLGVELRSRLAAALLSRGDAAQAEKLCHEMLDIQRAHLGPDHPDVAETLLLLASAQRKQLKSAEAVATNEEVVALARRLYGDEHPFTAKALLALGTAYDRMNRYDDSTRATQRALEVFRKTLGADHPSTVEALSNLGVSYKLSGRMAEAEPIYREVVDIRARTLGEHHPDTLQGLTYLGILLVARGKDAEARDIVHRTVRAYEALVAEPPEDATHLADFADFLLEVEPVDLQDPPRACALAERAVALTQRKNFSALRTLGMAQSRLGLTDEAIRTLRETLTLPDGVRSWTTEQMVVELLREHAPSEVEPFLVGRLEQLRVTRGPDERLAGKTLRLLALEEERLNRPAEAERRFAEAVTQLEKTLPETDWQVARAKSDLGAHLAARGAFAEAEPLLVQAHATLAADERAGKEREETRLRLVKLYEAWNRRADAERWRHAHASSPPP